MLHTKNYAKKLQQQPAIAPYTPSKTTWKQQLTDQTSTIRLTTFTPAPSRLAVKIKLTPTPLETDIAFYWSAREAEAPHYQPRISLPDTDTHCTLLRCIHKDPAPILTLNGSWDPEAHIARPEAGHYYVRVALPARPDKPPSLIVKTSVTPK